MGLSVSQYRALLSTVAILSEIHHWFLPLKYRAVNCSCFMSSSAAQAEVMEIWGRNPLSYPCVSCPASS